MSRHDTPGLDAAMDTPFDIALRDHFRSEPEPDDEGFSQRVVAALPAPVMQPRIRWAALAEHAQWTAISVAACGAAALLSIGDGHVDLAQQVAAYALIGLLVFWSVPSRWSRL
jgi:hypothetical protein